MASAEHRVGLNGAFQAELMLSLEPTTITNRRYPLLFQTGETAYGTRSLISIKQMLWPGYNRSVQGDVAWHQYQKR
jgi:hypothetical protein